MDLNTKVFGMKIKPKDMVGLFSLMETFMRAVGLMIKHMGMETTFTLREQHIKETGLKTNNTVRAEKTGLTEVFTKENIKEGKNME